MDNFPITKEELISLCDNAHVMSNLGNVSRVVADQVWNLMVEYHYSSGEFCKGLGKPTYIHPDCENRPGMWGWKDEETGIIFIYWNDCYKKSGYKGGSLEYVESSQKNKAQSIVDAAKRFLDHCVSISGYHPDPEYVKMLRRG